MPGQSGQGQGGAQGQQNEYLVKTTFTDAQGKVWDVGTVYTGDGEAVKKALAEGKIEARPKPTPQPA